MNGIAGISRNKCVGVVPVAPMLIGAPTARARPFESAATSHLLAIPARIASALWRGAGAVAQTVGEHWQHGARVLLGCTALPAIASAQTSAEFLGDPGSIALGVACGAFVTGVAVWLHKSHRHDHLQLIDMVAYHQENVRPMCTKLAKQVRSGKSLDEIVCRLQNYLVSASPQKVAAVVCEVVRAESIAYTCKTQYGNILGVVFSTQLSRICQPEWKRVIHKVSPETLACFREILMRGDEDTQTLASRVNASNLTGS